MTTATALQSRTEALSLVNARGKVLSVSSPNAGFFGYSPEELVGRSIFELIHLEDREQLRTAFLEVVTNAPGALRVNARVCGKNWKWSLVENTIVNLLDQPGVGAIVVKCQEIKAAVPELERRPSEDVPPPAGFEHFASALAHDLREPLRTISLLTDLLVRQVQHVKEVQLLAQSIIDGVARASALLDGLDSLAVPGLDDVQTQCDLEQVLKDVVQNLAATIDVNEAVVTMGALPVVRGDPSHLLRVFQNLIANAIKYRGTAPPQIHVTAAVLGLGWIVNIKDNGVGIAEEYHETVFRFLERLHGPKISGTGIGLALCKKIVEAYGGRIWVESNPEGGSTFSFTVPAMAEQAPDSRGRASNVRAKLD